ncbi:MAG: pilus assembly protein PilM [Bacteroidales bacterium]|nr:pilus assembly protein PilM [Bacteroidales bacterium]
MNRETVIVAIDLGSTEARMVVAQNLSNSKYGIKLLNYGCVPLSGMRRGEVYDVSMVSYAVSELTKKYIKNVKRDMAYCVTVGGMSLKTIRNVKQQDAKTGKVSVTQQMLDSLKDKVENDVRNTIGEDMQIINTEFIQYVLDQVSTSYKRPSGLCQKIEATAICTIINRNVLNAISQSFVNPLPRPEAYRPSTSMKGIVLLNSLDKENCMALVDLGAQNIGVAIYEHGQLCYESSLPFGCQTITDDISNCWKISAERAEMIKRIGYRKNASSGPLCITVGEEIYDDIDNAAKLNFVIVARLREIAAYVGAELVNANKFNMIRSVKLTGGGAKMPGICDIFRMQLTKDTTIIRPEVEGMNSDDFLRYSAAIGLASDIIRKNNEMQTDNTLNFGDEQPVEPEEAETDSESKEETKKEKPKKEKKSWTDRFSNLANNMFGSEGEDMQ